MNDDQFLSGMRTVVILFAIMIFAAAIVLLIVGFTKSRVQEQSNCVQWQADAGERVCICHENEKCDTKSEMKP